METTTTIFTRRSVREFSEKPVPKQQIMKILEAGIHAPSSKNCQPWFFLVDTTEKKIQLQNISNSMQMHHLLRLTLELKNLQDQQLLSLLLKFCKMPLLLFLFFVNLHLLVEGKNS